ncbi:MAG: CehA/McbA family metallohydrolase [Planctomycetota bacterium]|jgi:hypothetical protein
MSRGIQFVTAGLLTAALTASIASAAERVNVITNGGFEEATAGWTAAEQHAVVTEPAEAHSGKACLAGEVTEPNQALFLRRKVPVRAGNRYQFEIWAKATNRTKLVLWAVEPGADPATPVNKARKLIAAFENVPRQWRHYTTPIAVRQDGVLELMLVAPSSHRAPPGKIWLDDVALYETKMPQVVNASGGEGFNDEPAMAVADDGSVYVAFNGFREGVDSLRIARYQPQGNAFGASGRWQVLGGEGTYLLGPVAVSAGSQAIVVYAAEIDKTWDVYTVTCGPDGPGEPVAVTSNGGVDVKPAAAWRDGTLWAAWESNRNGCRQVFAAPVDEGRVGEPAAVSGPGVSSYNPSVAVLANGQVCVAWHSFRENNYDVYLRQRSADGSWQPERRLTSAPSVDRHPVLAARGDDLWLVYENAQTGGRNKPYRLGATDHRRLVVAQVTPRGLLAPKGKAPKGKAPNGNQESSPLYGRSEAAHPAFDSSGRLWLAFLKPRAAKNWDVFVTCLTGDGWLEPAPVSVEKGMDRRPILAVLGDRGLVAFQADPNPNSFPGIEQANEATSDVYLAGFDLEAPPASGPPALEPLVEPDEPFEAGQIRVARGEDLPTPTIEYGGQELKLFFGDLHEHTEVSSCNRNGDQSIDESYQHMRDIARYDFACATDHGYNITPYLWSYTAKLARTNHDADRFLTFLAEEWTSTFEQYSEKHPYGFYGHRNLVFADPYFPRWWNARNYQTPAQVWEELRKMDANFIHVPHQLADRGNVPTDWDFADEEAQPVAEMFQIRGSYEYKGTPREADRSTPEPGYFLQDAWARGIVIGVIASPDHGGGYGKACVYAPELSREAILDAIRARHCYGSTAAKIVLDVRVAGHLMGEKVAAEAPGTVSVEVRAQCPAEIDRIEVCRNNQFVYTKAGEGRRAEFAFVDRQPVAGRSYYYVRLIQKDEEIAWTSPVWFGAE